MKLLEGYCSCFCLPLLTTINLILTKPKMWFYTSGLDEKRCPVQILQGTVSVGAALPLPSLSGQFIFILLAEGTVRAPHP